MEHPVVDVLLLPKDFRYSREFIYHEEKQKVLTTYVLMNSHPRINNRFYCLLEEFNIRSDGLSNQCIIFKRTTVCNWKNEMVDSWLTICHIYIWYCQNRRQIFICDIASIFNSYNARTVGSKFFSVKQKRILRGSCELTVSLNCEIVFKARLNFTVSDVINNSEYKRALLADVRTMVTLAILTTKSELDVMEGP
ncbi:hypothetical protein V1478_008540 [Vespula squamosa]|uniref:Uncharacterized protein n=1 Tax=Vespula squamosa TaxID=30214 RepID=A0ABD2AUM7_VESSQ